MTTQVELTPRISVVVPVYCHTQDHKLFLREALQSVAAQRFGSLK